MLGNTFSLLPFLWNLRFSFVVLPFSSITLITSPLNKHFKE